MPVEFSHAAYRFGHSMVRPLYRLNALQTERLTVFSGFGSGVPDLSGFKPVSDGLAIDWPLFFKLDARAPQSAYKMDASLVHPLSLLPSTSINSLGPVVLSDRNLLRGAQFGLPSGEDVARAMGERLLRPEQILIGKATGDAADAQTIASINAAFSGKTPLWAYLLAESVASSYPVREGAIAGEATRPYRLGPVGGRIVAETLVGVMAFDAASVINTPAFRPDARYGGREGHFGFADLIRVVTQPDDVAFAPPRPAPAVHPPRRGIAPPLAPPPSSRRLRRPPAPGRAP